MSEKISVIVPVYNVKDYLEKCVQSILQQTYVHLEIILVDDGSTDGSEVLCEQLKQLDSRIKVIHQKNQGLSGARNTGVKYATGEFVSFIDSDDYIAPTMLETLVRQLKQSNADVASCNIMNVYTKKSQPQYDDITLQETLNTQTFLKEYLLGQKVPGSICNKLIRMAIAKQLQFPVGKLYEDAFYQYDLLNIAQKYVINTQPDYYYMHRNNSITTTPFSAKDMDYIVIYQKFYALVQQQFPSLEEVAFFRLAYAHFFLLDKMLTYGLEEKNEAYQQIVSFLQRNAYRIAKNSYFRKGRRIAAICLKINIKLYAYLLNKENAKKGLANE